MSRYLESIKICQGRPYNLEYHQMRFSAAQQELWGSEVLAPLEHYLPINLPREGLYKLRLAYDRSGVDAEIQPYNRPLIKRLHCVYTAGLDYHLKSEDRSVFSELKQNLESGDEILIINNGLVADTSFTNLAFWDGRGWYTPEDCLLEGTQRANLLNNNILTLSKIAGSDLGHFLKVALFNAMIEWDERIELDSSCIIDIK